MKRVRRLCKTLRPANVCISLRIVLAFLLVCCSLTIASALVYYRHCREVVLESIQHEALLLCEHAEHDCAIHYSSVIEKQLRLLARSSPLDDYLMSSKEGKSVCRAEVERFFLSLAEGSKNHLSTTFIGASGRGEIAIHGRKRAQTYQALREIARDETWGLHVEELFVNLRSDDSRELAHTPVFRDAQGRVRVVGGIRKNEPQTGGFGGIVVQHYDLTDFIRTISSGHIMGIPVMWVYGRDGQVLHSPPECEVVKTPNRYCPNGKRDPGPTYTLPTVSYSATAFPC